MNMENLSEALHPDFRPLAAQLSGMTIDIEADLAAAREQLAAASAAGGPWSPPPGLEVAERHAPGPAGPVRLRVYRPQEGEGPRSALLFFHGGSFSLGDPELEDAKCAELALAVGCVVVSAGYRLAPEHPFPAGLEDAHAVLRWLADPAGGAGELGVEPARIAVGGSSAGGCLAAALALLARDEGGPRLAAQLLLCPPLDDLLATRSATRFTATPIFDRGAARTMRRYYLGADHRPGSASPYAAPARAPSWPGCRPPSSPSAGSTRCVTRRSPTRHG